MGDKPLSSPRHRRLGKPLPYQLANVTHAHPIPSKLSLISHAKNQSYGVLVEFSLRYPPVKGRLHTRYAPVRRSPPRYCYLALPLDLHVLSLPLAFILSQDQTLHCKNCSSFYLLDSSRVSHLPRRCPTHAISIFSSVSKFFRFSDLVRSKTGAKIQPFFKLTKYFFAFFRKYF